MARVLALTRDLLFGSRVQGALTLAGHEVRLVGDEAQLRESVAVERPGERSPAHSAAGDVADVLVVDLTDQELDGVAIVQALTVAGELRGTRTLAFYAHVDDAMRQRAQQAGFDSVVPRSRMAREGPELVAQLLDGR
jgi:CheY-like chemotaxis protein